MERPGAIDAGTFIITGLVPEIILDSDRLVFYEFEHRKEYLHICPKYQVENTSYEKIMNC